MPATLPTPTPMSSDTIRTQFFARLRALEAEFPMVYLTAITPNDMRDAVCDTPGDDADWTQPHWPRVVIRLERDYDYGHGTTSDDVSTATTAILGPAGIAALNGEDADDADADDAGADDAGADGADA